ncbi:hypothetical protein ACHAPT_009517 [Fusarium lateritium]
MAQFLCYKWIPPKDSPDWTCKSRGFDALNENAEVTLRFPWIRWPGDMDPNDFDPSYVREMADKAVVYWIDFMVVKVRAELLPRCQLITCMIQMYEQALHILYTLRDTDRNLRGFYAFVAGYVARLEEMRPLRFEHRFAKITDDGRFAIKDFAYQVRVE